MTLVLHASAEEVMRAVEAVQDFARANGVADTNIFGLALALEECGSNIVNHGLKRDARQTFSVTLETAAGEFVMELRDRGPEFDPTAAAADVSTPEDDDPPGRWGIRLVRRYVDEIRYTRVEGENILRLRKRLPPALGEAHASPTPPKPQQTPTRNVMPLEIQFQKNIGPKASGAVTVTLIGSLDTATAPELERQLAPVLGGGTKDLVFDLAQLKFISSAGLRVFSTARKTLKERGGQASFVHMQPQIQEVFEIIKALPGIAVFQNVAELDSYLAARQRAYDQKEQA
jgi:anti-anti-sigma factor